MVLSLLINLYLAIVTTQANKSQQEEQTTKKHGETYENTTKGENDNNHSHNDNAGAYTHKHLHSHKIDNAAAYKHSHKHTHSDDKSSGTEFKSSIATLCGLLLYI